jgi:hypothetical protein
MGAGIGKARDGGGGGSVEVSGAAEETDAGEVSTIGEAVAEGLGGVTAGVGGVAAGLGGAAVGQGSATTGLVGVAAEERGEVVAAAGDKRAVWGAVGVGMVSW